MSPSLPQEEKFPWEGGGFISDEIDYKVKIVLPKEVIEARYDAGENADNILASTANQEKKSQQLLKDKLYRKSQFSIHIFRMCIEIYSTKSNI